ncbi:unnamed protein product [Timema podura]|uniref:Uncharacterized protein n=1 Tax=Timema podura TaxID=61482 RepID=A0ABN7PMM4_TIMPD|nr:unnamed protein product [Timema podura]
MLRCTKPLISITRKR